VQLSAGARLGPYEVVSPLGAGGMGEVYRARDTQLNRDVAVKVLPELFAADAERVGRFTREAQTLAALNHPNIAQVYGLEGSSGGRRALVMELVEGEDLSAIIARGPVPLAEVLPIARQIAEALEAAHEAGIIHRDLKPANIKVRPDGTVKVLDFGLAKAVVREGAHASADAMHSPTFTAHATHLGVILGTAAYMAPEQARGLAIDRRADVWAFGAVLFEMLTGSRPFAGDTITDVIAAVLKEPVPLDRLPNDVTPPVRALVRRCLEKDPKQRLRDIGEARVLLSAPAATLLDATTPAAAGPQATPARSTTRLLMAIVTMLGLASGAAAYLLWSRQPPMPAEVVRFDVLPPDGAAVDLTIRPSVTVSPDGSMIAFTASSSGTSRLYLRRRDVADVRPLVELDEGSTPVFSPDGQSLAVVSGTRLLKVSLDGQLTPLATVMDSRGLAWLDPSTIIYTPEATGGLWRIPANGGEPAVVSTPDPAKGERTHRWPAVLPGGGTVLYTVGSAASPDDYDGSAIEALTLATGRTQVVLEGASFATYASSGHLLFARAGSLHAVPFDPVSLRVSGSAVPVVQGIMSDRTTGAAHVSIAANGTLAYVPGGAIGAQHRVVWIESRPDAGRPDAQTTVTTSVELPPAPYQDLAVSPDGSRVAFIQGASGSADVWIHDFGRRSTTRLTFDSRTAAPIWSADSRTVYYSSIAPSGITTTFMRKPADGSREAEPVASVNARAFLTELLADGAVGLVELARVASTVRDIGRIPLSPGSAKEVAIESLVATDADEYGADVTADGRWLAYSSDETGRMEVYVRDLSGAGGEEPHWAGDGGRLFYRNVDGLYAASIDTKTGFTAALPQLWYRGAYNLRSDTSLTFDVDPKTGRLLMMRPSIDDKSRAPVRVVVNWFEELRRQFSR
jgi:hypothetical protein